MNWREAGALSVVFAALSALGLFIFPGHSFLLSDTQIYVPLFKHLLNPELLRNELILSGAHLSYTIYDEATLGLTRAFGLEIEQALFAQQFFFRWLGYWGAYWFATAIGFSRAAGVLASALLWLGAFVYGPAVITTEFEPVPRGFAVPLIVLALGAAAKQHRHIACAALVLAFLYHAPAVWPLLLVATIFRRWRPLGYTAGAAFLLMVLASNQQGTVEAQPFFSLIDAGQRKIQQLRAPYNWISLWPSRYWLQYLLTGAIALAAFRRLKDRLPVSVQPYLQWMPLIGWVTMPLSYLLLEQMGWALLPQVQPMRALLYCHLFCQMLGTLAAFRELEDGQWLRAVAWLLVPVSLSLRGDLLQTTGLEKEAMLLVLLTGCVALASLWPRKQLLWVAPFGLSLLFGYGFEARAFQPVETPDLNSLADWAATKSPVDAQFLFPDLGRRPEPGIFRARSARAVYVCWKQGGQVNYFPQYASTWFERWTNLLAPNHPPLDYNDLRRRGVTHLVFTKEVPAEDLTPVYVSRAYRVYLLSR